MALAALDYVYATEADLQALLSTDGETGRLDDDQSGAIDGPEPTYLIQALNWATSQVNLYLLGTYPADGLAQNWLVNNWTVILAAHWLSCRRGNPAPGSFDDLKEQALKDLENVRSGRFKLPDVAPRDAHWPAWSNVRVDVLYPLRKIRVERPISEPTPVNYPQARDYAAEAFWFNI